MQDFCGKPHAILIFIAQIQSIAKVIKLPAQWYEFARNRCLAFVAIPPT